MQQRNEFISVDSFVRDVLSSIDDAQADSYVKLLRITIRVMEDLQVGIMPKPKTVVETVQDNLAIHMPRDTRDVIFIVHLVRHKDRHGNMVDMGWPLGKKPRRNLTKRYTLITQNRFDCSIVPDDVDASDLNNHWQFFNGGPEIIYFSPWYYGEVYGYKEDYVYGYWEYDPGSNRVVFDSGGIVTPGSTVAVEYHASELDDPDSIIERGKYNLYRTRVLQQYYEANQPQKALYFFSQFKREISMHKRDRLGKNSMDDYINAFARAYSSAPR